MQEAFFVGFTPRSRARNVMRNAQLKTLNKPGFTVSTPCGASQLEPRQIK